MIPTLASRSGDVTSISRGRTDAGDMRKNAVLRGISALHAGQPIAGLRYSGKGANRTILDCSLSPVGPERGGLLPPRGSRAPAASRSTGAGPAAAADERVWNRDDSVFGGASDTP